MTALEIFKITAKEFAHMTDEEIQGCLDLYSPFVSKKRFVNLYEYALAYYTAHNLALQKASSINADAGQQQAVASGVVVEEREGDLQRKYANPYGSINVRETSAENLIFYSTPYGRLYLDVARRRRLPGVTRMGGELDG